LQLQQTLGQGASGVIHQAQWQNSAGEQPVAVKLFKGAVTSDGLPQHEMTACLQAGAHPHLIPVLGQLADHPGGEPGLVMALIDPGFRTLAGPPSLDSCTRDSYAPDTGFDLPTAISIALTIASAARHLHAQGLMHGDLYAHNILHNTQGAALLGDFGAASFLAPQDQPQALALQRLEVRAFACLLEELLERCTPPAEAAPAWETLTNLKTAGLQETPGARPLFAEIEQLLRALYPRL
jgi:serine/threonine protein kinase